MRRLYLIPTLFLVSCTQSTNMAPVVELKWRPQSYNQRLHCVKPGETLYAIAFRYDKDFRELAAYNHLSPPYSLRVGQVIHLNHSSSRSRAYVPRVIYKSYSKPVPIYAQKIPFYKQTNLGAWKWPVNGKIINYFSPEQGKKGIDIAGKKGDKVYASASGSVAYAGNGLSGYGNLIIIKHNGQFLTAYGNNSRNLVVEGQQIKAGQVIAEIGIVDRKFWGVHFEIRKSGQPINPLTYLH